MANIVDYARNARDTFAERPFCRLDALCLSWLAYLRLPSELGVENRAGVRLADLGQGWLLPHLTTTIHDRENSERLIRALAASPRFGNVRACLHVAESSDAKGMQFTATTFVLPEGAGACVTFGGTDNSIRGWKENLGLVCDTAIPAQSRAALYLDQTVEELGIRLWVSGHSKGGALAVYACAAAQDATLAQLDCCFCFDGPALCPEVAAGAPWPAQLPLVKVVPRASLVGMLFERSQQELVVVRSSAVGVMQHAPFSWEVLGNDFVCEQGMDYDAWRLSQRLNDWLDTMDAATRRSFAELLGWLLDTTGEATFSGLLSRWSSNRQTMMAALDAAPEADRMAFAQALDDLTATVLLGSRKELGLDWADTPTAATEQASRRLEDASAKVNDRLAQLDRLTGR